MTTTTAAPTALPTAGTPTVAEQAPKLLGQIAGYMAHRTIAMGIRSGLLSAFAQAPGSSATEVADRLRLDPSYVAVWCRSALASEVLERDADGYRLAPHLDTLLLDTASPAYVGGVFLVAEAPEMFGRFEANLASGARMWWDDTSPEWIAGVAGTGTPFYSRLVPGGLDRVPGLADQLAAGCRIADTACGAGVGLHTLAARYPNCEIVGIDGDQHSIDLARERVQKAGLTERVQLICSPLEDFTVDTPVRLVINNISMHECRDIDRVTERVRAALEPDGWFVISDFPFPDSDQALRTPAGRVMSGIQFFEAQIDDQLLPRAAYDELLSRHGFHDLGSAQLTPMHAITWGRA